MTVPSLDLNPLDLTPDWFNAMFARAGIDAVVKSLTAKSIGTGQIGENVRFVFDYTRRGPNASDTLVGKFPSDDPSSIATAKLLGHYRREVMFYRTFDVARKIAPAVLYTDYDAATNRFALIMQDMAPAVQGDQLAGCGLADAEQAIDAAVILHAAHWNDASLDQHDWLQGTDAAPPEPITPQMLAGLWGGFKDRYADRLTPDIEETGDLYSAYMATAEDPYEGPLTLTHGDFRLDNMLFTPAGTGPAPSRGLAVVDWQTPGKRGPMADVAYFIGAGFTQADRPKYEQALLQRYHAGLASHGIADYSLQAMQRDYAWFAFYGMSVAFGAAMLVQQTPRGDELFLTMLRRHTAQVRANGGLDLIG